MATVECVHCGQMLEIEAGSGDLITCPVCGKGFSRRGGAESVQPAPTSGALGLGAGSSWHLTLPDGQRFGPAGEGEIIDWMQQGRVPAGSLVWKNGFADWLAIDTVAPFSGYPVAPSRPAPSAHRATALDAYARAQHARPSGWSGAAITGFVLSLTVGWIPFIGGLATILFSAIGLSATSGHKPRQGKGFAIAGLVLGILNLLAWVIIYAVIIPRTPTVYMH